MLRQVVAIFIVGYYVACAAAAADALRQPSAVVADVPDAAADLSNHEHQHAAISSSPSSVAACLACLDCLAPDNCAVRFLMLSVTPISFVPLAGMPGCG
jgi:hypothetical protein